MKAPLSTDQRQRNKALRGYILCFEFELGLNGRPKLRTLKKRHAQRRYGKNSDSRRMRGFRDSVRVIGFPGTFADSDRAHRLGYATVIRKNCRCPGQCGFVFDEE